MHDIVAFFIGIIVSTCTHYLSDYLMKKTFSDAVDDKKVELLNSITDYKEYLMKCSKNALALKFDIQHCSREVKELKKNTYMSKQLNDMYKELEVRVDDIEDKMNW